MSGKPSAKWASAVLSTAAIADHTTRTILTDKLTGIAGVDVAKGGMLDYIEVMVFPTATAAVAGYGGLIELNNKSYDWMPCNFYTDTSAMLTADGLSLRPQRIYMKKWIPDNSRIVAYYTADNAAADMLMIMFHWQLGNKPTTETFMDAAKGTAITQVTQAAKHVTFTACPTTRAGVARALMVVPIGALETIVCEGGHINAWNSHADWVPTQGITGSLTGKIEVSGDIQNNIMELNHPLLGNSITYLDYTPVDNQSQFLHATLVWES